jgi:hypothetical protein
MDRDQRLAGGDQGGGIGPGGCREVLRWVTTDTRLTMPTTMMVDSKIRAAT